VSALAPSPAEVSEFRDGVRRWFDERSSKRSGAKFTGEGADPRRARAWQRQLYDAGLAGVSWPQCYGGGGGEAWQDVVVREEASGYVDSSEDVCGTAIGLAGPVIVEHGTEAQRRAHLRPILSGDEVWCQLFSEPDAGSDLASLTTRATRDGSGWVVNGQKVWSSGAHLSDFGLLLARTDPDRPRHRGISCFILPMRAAGVEVRPLRQLTGDSHFSEVFLVDVRLDEADLLGELHGGWAVARTILAQERTLIAGGGGLAVPVKHLVELAAMSEGIGDGDGHPVHRDRLIQAWIRERLIDMLSQRFMGDEVIAMSSLVKLAMATHVELTTDLAMELLGPAATLASYELPPTMASWQRAFLGQWLIRIGGGTAQIQRNIVGERILELPLEPAGPRN
jgi:alkylation response protein AidB-like acyl-CoA dehydrogenase